MNYIPREMEPLVMQVATEYAAVLVTGPRQVGKSTLLEHVVASMGRDVERVTLDDLTELQLANDDPAMFFQLHELPVMIDEVQNAPGLFREIKRLIDAGAPAGSFLLTGSQQFRLMELAGETLAGRIAILPLSSLSQQEIVRSFGEPFNTRTAYWKERSSKVASVPITTMFDEMHRGAMPAVVAGCHENLHVFYESYIRTYIERDVRRMLGDVDALEYAAFMRAAAARCSQMLNVRALADDVGIRHEKAKAWLAVLERSGIVMLLHPYSNNQLNRTVKAPKLYFHDCGLVAHLTRWTSGQTMEAGAMGGAFMENFVVSEVMKGYQNHGLDAPLYYYRDHDAKEIDLVVVSDGELHPIEVKKTASPNRSMTSSFSALDRSPFPCGTGAIVCAAERFGALDADTLVIPVRLL